MLALRAFMFDHVYLGPDTRAEHERARATIHAIFAALAERGDSPEEITEFISGMTDRFALDYAAEPLTWRGSRTAPSKQYASAWTSSRSSRSARRCGSPAHGSSAAARSTRSGRRASRSNPIDKLYHCHGCHKGGDMIGFVRDTQALDFVGAIEWLAGRAGIVPEYEDASPADDARRNRRKRLLALLEDAAVFYERYLWDSPAGSFARDYLAGRGLGEPVSREFRLGLAIGGSRLARGAREKGFSAEEIRAAGLARQNGNDYFEQRLVFPLSDARGAVLGFQARRLHENDPLKAKYVNTPESELFTKGAVVYGLDKARARIAREDRAVVVEGNTDVIALRQAGFEPVVACMGTALTEQQLRELGRLTKKLVARLRRRRRRPGGDAPRNGARRPSGLRREGRRASRRDRPGRRSERLRRTPRDGAPVRGAPHPGGGARHRRSRGRAARSRRVPRQPPRFAASQGGLDVGDGLLRDADPDPRRGNGGRRGRALASPERARPTGSSAARSPA